jgi:glycosyltransferase involved in cell wall biosynthesis
MSNSLYKKKHTVLIDANKFGSTAPMDGTARYVNSLLKAMHKENPNEYEIFLLFNRKIILLENAINRIELLKESPPNALNRIRMRINRIFEQFKIIRKTVFSVKSYLFLKKIKSYQFDIIHILLPHRYYFIKGYLPNTILVMSIHDLTCKTVPQFHLYANTQTTWFGIVYSSFFCKGIICVSENTKRDFLNSFPGYNGVLAVTHLGFDDKLFYKEFNYKRIGNVKKKYGITSRHYILSLFTLEPRKNLRNLILAVELLRENNNCRHIELIIAGNLGWKMDKDFKFIKDAAGVKLIGYVEEQDLAPLYTGAVAFCYPSFYEGFGLPLLEAMACGTPVVFGNNSSMPEVVGDAGLGCDSNSPKDIMIQLHKICTNNDLRSKLSRESIKRSRQFSWAKCAKETFKVYDKVLYR